ncbi:early protein E5, partial [human papillomavirus 82]
IATIAVFLVCLFVLCVCVCLVLCCLLPLLQSQYVFAAALLLIICFWFVVATSPLTTFAVYIICFYIPCLLLHLYTFYILQIP